MYFATGKEKSDQEMVSHKTSKTSLAEVRTHGRGYGVQGSAKMLQ